MTGRIFKSSLITLMENKYSNLNMQLNRAAHIVIGRP